MDFFWTNPEFKHFERVANKRAKHRVIHGLLLLEELLGEFPIVMGDETLYLGISSDTFEGFSEEHKIELLRCGFSLPYDDSYDVLTCNGDSYEEIRKFYKEDDDEMD